MSEVVVFFHSDIFEKNVYIERLTKYNVRGSGVILYSVSFHLSLSPLLPDPSTSFFSGYISF